MNGGEAFLREMREKCLPSLLPLTPVQPLQHWRPGGGVFFVKRDDLAGTWSAAGKMRKYASLLPALQLRGVTHPILTGSENSNHLIAAVPLLRQAGMHPLVLAKAAHTRGVNARILSLLCAPRELRVHPRADWPSHAQTATEWAATLPEARTELIPEGACLPDAFPGATQLLADILRNEADSGLQFREIWTDAGTGLSAAGLWAAICHDAQPRTLHVVCCGGEIPDIAALAGNPGSGTQTLHLHAPAAGRSFGSTPAAVLDMVRLLARSEGLITEPLYSAKVFHTATCWYETNKAKGPVLLIHSGGTQVLPGFPEILS